MKRQETSKDKSTYWCLHGYVRQGRKRRAVGPNDKRNGLLNASAIEGPVHSTPRSSATSRPQMLLPICLTRVDTLDKYSTTTLLDSGATLSCVNQKFVNDHRIPTTKLEQKQRVFNADGTPNRSGFLREFVTMRMKIDNHEE